MNLKKLTKNQQIYAEELVRKEHRLWHINPQNNPKIGCPICEDKKLYNFKKNK